MERYVRLTEEKRIGVTSEAPMAEADAFAFDFPKDFDFEGQLHWKIIDGALVHDPIPEETGVDEITSLREQVELLTACIVEMAGIVYE